MAQTDTPASPKVPAERHAHVVHRLRQTHRKPKVDHKHPVNKRHYEEASFGARVADKLAAGMGSWPFIITQSVLLLVWVAINYWGLFVKRWDVYPFILLNLLLSLQATYAGPIVLLAGNRQSKKDRLTLEHAAEEADKGEEHITRILIEIKKNTDLTLRILTELEAESA
ncbi:MAG: DUF1003 domain-containing protein [Candidatus Dormibacteraeota bacterium]|nr:DUF1003 domain-containing protein [Candidatus Dormibacteraeota bacterium]